MKRIIALAVGVLGLFGAAIGISTAAPGPNGDNNHGLCTAYYNGQKNGHGDREDPDHQPPPFQSLEDQARDYTDSDGDDNDGNEGADEGSTTPDPTDDENTDLTAAENIANFCGDQVSGNTAHGRYTCDYDTDDNPANGNQPSCEVNPAPNED